MAPSLKRGEKGRGYCGDSLLPAIIIGSDRLRRIRNIALIFLIVLFLFFCGNLGAGSPQDKERQKGPELCRLI